MTISKSRTSGVRTRRRQRGSALITSLMILVVMTMIGVGAIRTAATQRETVGDMRDHNLAFQASETGLREAERFLDNAADTVAFGDSAGLLGVDQPEPGRGELFEAASWGDANSVRAGGMTADERSSPRYRVKLLRCNAGTRGGLNVQGYGYGSQPEQTLLPNHHLFRVTALGVGGSERNLVVLRSVYGKLGLAAKPGECAVSAYRG